MKKVVIILLLVCVSLPEARAKTRFMADYFLFKPNGRLGYQFASSFYYGIKIRQSMFWLLSCQLNAGKANSYTGLGELYFPVRKTPWEGERVNVKVVPISLTFNLAPREAVVTPYLSFGPGFYLLSSSLANKALAAELLSVYPGPVTNYVRDDGSSVGGDIVNEATWPTFDGTAIGMIYGFGFWVGTESNTEIGFNMTFHRPKINLGEVRHDANAEEWVPFESTLNILLMTFSIGKGF
jgi:hypothetical protein